MNTNVLLDKVPRAYTEGHEGVASVALLSK